MLFWLLSRPTRTRVQVSLSLSPSLSHTHTHRVTRHWHTFKICIQGSVSSSCAVKGFLKLLWIKYKKNKSRLTRQTLAEMNVRQSHDRETSENAVGWKAGEGLGAGAL